MRHAPPLLVRSFVILALAAASAGAQQAEAHRIADAAAVFTAVADLPERDLPALMLREAWGVAVFPGVRRLGLVVGVQRGDGILIARTKGGGWSAPLFVRLEGATAGWQVGVQSVDLVLFFLTPESVDRTLRGGLTLGVDIAVAAGGLGRQAGAGTDTDLQAEVVSYARTRGFYAGATIGGTAIEADEPANEAFYGVDRPRAADILAGKLRAVPPSADLLRKAVEARAGAGRPAPADR